MIAAVIVLYHPDKSVLQNIASYIDTVDLLYAIDNSDRKNSAIIEAIQKNPKIHYIDNHGNHGIAQALNTGAGKAIEAGYNWLLTMDQDSMATPDMMTQMLRCLELGKDKEVGILSPFHADRFNRESSSEAECTIVLTTMTSGNLLNLHVYQKVGPFREDFFIDRVDIEYCLRLKKMGYDILHVKNAILHHNVGNLTKHRFFNRFVYPSNHPPLRHYYMARNQAKVIQMYYRHFPVFCLKEINHQIGNIAKIIFYEKDKWLKLRMIFLGWFDFTRSRFGKFDI